MLRVDLKLGFACNNRCEFCVQGDKRTRHGARPFARIRQDLLEAWREGAREVVFTGGEPTLHDGLLPAIRLARELGYQHIQLQTNGRRLAYLPVCRALIAAGVTEYSPSLHAASPETHDRLTRVRSSHAQTLEGIRNLVALGQRVVTNSVITEVALPELPALARLLVHAGVSQFQFAYVHILGSAAANAGWLAPRQSAAMPFVRSGLDVGRASGVRCLTEAIPYCLMRGYEEHVAERVIPPSRIYDAEQVIVDYTAYRRAEGKAKRAECRACRWDAVCEGPWREYPEHFGWSEFQPVP
jgi:MoaA/NifB/PqqE/SkfB family radical SAM enzyme